MFIPLNFPKTELKLSKKQNEYYVWCVFRKKKLLLTPEEWVRQHVLHYMVKHKQYPLGLIASEFAIEVNELSRRCDAVIFNKQALPLLIVECKAPDVAINEAVFHQIAQYNFKLKVEWLVMTNGLTTIVANVNQKTGDIAYTQEIPDYTALV